MNIFKVKIIAQFQQYIDLSEICEGEPPYWATWYTNFQTKTYWVRAETPKIAVQYAKDRFEETVLKNIRYKDLEYLQAMCLEGMSAGAAGVICEVPK